VPPAMETDTAAPPDLGDLLRTGAVLFGVRVTAVRIETADGRVQRLMLPEPTAGGEAEADDGEDAPPLSVELNEFQRRVVRHFAGLAPRARLRGNVLTEAVREDESDSTARRHLAELVKLDVLTNPRDMDGYGRGPAFANALKSVGD
jgi:hypothetical protein